MKSVLKKILPSTWTAALANALNKFNHLILVPLFFKEYPQNKITYLNQNSIRPIDFIYHQPSFAYQDLPSRIKEAFKDFNNFEQKEFAARVEQCLIEPKYGWPMTKSRELIYDCFPHSRQHIIPIPSPFLKLNKKCREFDSIISFREIFEFGYWHFYTDIIHKNYVLNALPEINKNIPILISKELSEKAYFKFFYEQTDVFAGRDIIIQDDFLVSAAQTYFIKPMPHKPEYYRMTSEKVNRWKGESTLNRKIFLTRNRNRGRFVTNMDEIIAVLRKYDFEFVDTDTLTTEQQIGIFSETEFLIGIHGAGLTNMMFRSPHHMNVLEIFPLAQGRFQIPSHYFLLSGIFGFSYRALLGSSYINNLKKSFRVNPSLLESEIRILLGK